MNEIDQEADEQVASAQAESTDQEASFLTRMQDEAGALGKSSQERSENEQGDETKKASVVPETPEGYAFAFAEGFQVDEALLGGFKTTAHELGISTEQAQKLADFYAGYAGDAAQKAQQAQAETVLQQRKAWEGEITSNPQYAEEASHALRALKEFGSPELTKTMDQSGIGLYPPFFAFMARIGKALAEPGVVGSGSSGRQRTAAEVLYGDNHN